MMLETYLRGNLVRNSSTSGSILVEFAACDSFKQAAYTWAGMSLLCFAAGFPASLLILWEMFQTYRRGLFFTPNDFFILNISVMDAVFLAFIPPGLLNHFFLQNREFENLWDAAYALNTCGRPFLMACVCLDCYLAVVHPIFYHKRKSLTPRVVSAAIAWTLSAVFGILYFVFLKLYISFFSVAIYLISIIIIGLCDGVIVYNLLKSDGNRHIHPQKQRAIQTLIYSLAMTTVSYLPPVILFSVGGTLTHNFVCNIVLPSSITATLGSTLMPMLYLHNVGKLNCPRIGCCRQ